MGFFTCCCWKNHRHLFSRRSLFVNLNVLKHIFLTLKLCRWFCSSLVCGRLIFFVICELVLLVSDFCCYICLVDRSRRLSVLSPTAVSSFFPAIISEFIN